MAGLVTRLWRLRHPVRHLGTTIRYKGGFARQRPWRTLYLATLAAGVLRRAVRPPAEVAAVEVLAPGQRVEIRAIDPRRARAARRRR